MHVENPVATTHEHMHWNEGKLTGQNFPSGPAQLPKTHSARDRRLSLVPQSKIIE